METLEAQREAWDAWLAEAKRHEKLGDVPADQLAFLHACLEGHRKLSILDVGCGSGWTCKELAKYGAVTGTDLAPEAIKTAQRLFPEANFVAGDFMSLDLRKVDCVVSLEVLSHVADQPAFIRKLAELLNPGGMLLLATQNAAILNRCPWIPPSPPGRIRNWVDREQLVALLEPHFRIEEMRTLTPAGNTGALRYINSPKVAALIGPIIGRKNWKRLREAFGIGWTIVVRARKR